MIKIGQFMFKHRGWLPVPILAILFFSPVYTISSKVIAIGILLIALGETGRLWCVGYAGGITRTRKGDLDELITTGPFAYVRNPIYISNMIMYSGAMFLLGTQQLLPFVLIYFVIQYSFIVVFEESLLSSTFGSSYDEYKKLVSRWLPNPFTRISRSSHPFDFYGFIVAEKSTLGSILAIVAIAIAKHYYVHAR